MSGHKPSSGPGQHDAQRSAQRHQSQPQGPQQGTSSYQSQPQGPQQGISSHQSQPQGPQQGTSSHQSQPQGPQQGASSHRSQPQGPQQGTSSHRSQPQGPQQGTSSHRSQPQGPQQGACSQQSPDVGRRKRHQKQVSQHGDMTKRPCLHRSQSQWSQQGSCSRQSPQGATPLQPQQQSTMLAAETIQASRQGSGQHGARGQDQHGASPHQSLPQVASPMPLSSLAAEALWRAEIRQWFPALHSQTYFVPSLHFNRPSYDVQIVARQLVLVPQVAPDQPHPQPAYFPPTGPPPPRSDPPLASQLWPTYQAVPPGPLSKVCDADVRADRAMQVVHNFIRQLTEKIPKEARVMVVLSELQFRKYLDEEVSPISAAAIRLLPRPATLKAPKKTSKSKRLKNLKEGDFDMLMINGKYGLIAIEVKSVGAAQTQSVGAAQTQSVGAAQIQSVGAAKTQSVGAAQTQSVGATQTQSVGAAQNPPPGQGLKKTVEKAIEQLDKSKLQLQHLTFDLARFRITKTLALPFIESKQLERTLAADQQLLQGLCQCLGVPVTGVPGTDAAAAVSRCLCAEDVSDPTSSVWWQRTVTDHGPDANMTPELYERLAARFCGPATTIEVPTVTTPRRTVGLRTLSEGVALTGLTYSLLTLYPEQVNLVSRPRPPGVFVWGPPGTGKTIVLVLKAIQWLHQGKDIHVLSTWTNSRAVTRLIEQQLLHAASTSAAAAVATTSTASASVATPTSTAAQTAPTSGTAGPRVHTHFYDFERNKGDVEAAVEELESVARDGQLFVLVDECHHGGGNTRGRFAQFCTLLARRVPGLHLWAANVQRDDVTTNCLVEERLTTPVRCPPAVVDQVARSVWINDRLVPRYSSNSAIPAATDGPAVRELPPHWQRSPRYGATLSPGHTGDVFLPETCTRCAENIADLLTRELRVGQTGQPLEHRDVIVLCDDPREDLPVVTRLRARGVPVQVVRRDADEAVVRDVALAVRDAVTVTEREVVSGLERRVVVALGDRRSIDIGFVGVDVNYERLLSMSRSTALVVWAGGPF